MKEKYIITRTMNGWILETPEENAEGIEYMRTQVFEDVDHYSDIDDKVSESASLSNLLWSCFSYYFQEKRRGGLVTEMKKYGREHYSDE